MADTVRVDLGPVMRQIQTVGQTLSSQIDGVTTEVGQVRNDLRLTNDELRYLRAEFDLYVQQATRTAAVQLSTTQAGNLKAQLDRDFGHYALVRRTSVGTLQAFDVGVISNDTVTSVSEELMIQTPRYWLAPALVAVAAWSRDNRETAERAVQEAFSRDKNKTSLFFALVLRRQGRTDASVRWLRHYLSSLDPTALTREFAVVLEAASYEAFGPEGQMVVSERMEEWVERLRADDGVVEQQVRRWIGELGVMRRKLDTSQYATLATLATEFPEFQRQIESASALPETTEKYEAIRDYEASIPSVLEDLLDDILDTLVTEYDEEELPLRREVLYHESVIDEMGDTDCARARADELQRALDDTTDAVSLQTEAAINPDHLGVSIRTQRIAIGISIDELRSATNRYTAEYRGRAIAHVNYNFDATHSNYASTFKFAGVNVNSAVTEDEGALAIKDTWHKTMDAYIAAAAFNPKKLLLWGAVAAVISCLLIAANVAVGVVLLLISCGVVGFLAYREKEKADRAVVEAQQTRDKAVDDTVRMYREAGAQLVDARNAYLGFDEHEPELLRLIETWPTVAVKEVVA